MPTLEWAQASPPKLQVPTRGSHASLIYWGSKPPHLRGTNQPDTHPSCICGNTECRTAQVLHLSCSGPTLQADQDEGAPACATPNVHPATARQPRSTVTNLVLETVQCSRLPAVWLPCPEPRLHASQRLRTAHCSVSTLQQCGQQAACCPLLLGLCIFLA